MGESDLQLRFHSAGNLQSQPHPHLPLLSGLGRLHSGLHWKHCHDSPHLPGHPASRTHVFPPQPTVPHGPHAHLHHCTQDGFQLLVWQEVHISGWLWSPDILIRFPAWSRMFPVGYNGLWPLCCHLSPINILNSHEPENLLYYSCFFLDCWLSWWYNCHCSCTVLPILWCPRNTPLFLWCPCPSHSLMH